jgi:hypothetical protein
MHRSNACQAEEKIAMSRALKALFVLTVVSLGVWGCNRGSGNRAAQLERVRSLETRCAKLEQDYRTVARARDQARQQRELLEAETAQLKKDLEAQTLLARDRDQLSKQLKDTLADREELKRAIRLATTEREELQAQIASRVGERDSLQIRCERMRKGLQTLLAQDDVPAAQPNGPATILPAATAETAADPVGDSEE